MKIFVKPQSVGATFRDEAPQVLGILNKGCIWPLNNRRDQREGKIGMDVPDWHEEDAGRLKEAGIDFEF